MWVVIVVEQTWCWDGENERIEISRRLHGVYSEEQLAKDSMVGRKPWDFDIHECTLDHEYWG